MKRREEHYAKLFDSVAASGLTSSEKLVFTMLASYVRGGIHPRLKTLAARVGRSKITVRRALAKFRELGLITWKQTGRAHRFEISTTSEEKLVENIRVIKMSTQSDQNEHSDGPVSLTLNHSLSHPKNRPPIKSSSTVANPEPNRGGGPNGNEPKRKPPVREERPRGRVDFWPYPPEEVAIIRQSLTELAREVRLYPPDDDIVRRVLDAGGGAPARMIHESLVTLWRRGRFRGAESWGLIPFALAPVMSARMAAGP